MLSSVLGAGGAVADGGDRHLDEAALITRVASLGDRLRAHDARVVGLLVDNSPEWLIADLAVRVAGAVCVPLPGFFSDRQLAHVIEAAGMDLALAAPAERLLGLERGFRAVDEAYGLHLLARSPAGGQRMPADTAKITFTSGSTGTPKGVCLDDAAPLRLAATLREVLGPLGVSRHLSVLPYATLLENVAGAYAGLMAGATVVAPPMAQIGFGGDGGFDPERFLRCLHEVQPDSVILLPELLKALVVMRGFGASLPDSLKFLAVGGGKVGAGLVAQAVDLGLPVYEGYGLSECASVVSLNLPGAARPGSVGRPLPHVAVRLAGDGEIRVAGSAMLGYLGEAEVEGEIATGDLGEFDADGYLYVLGRKKNQLVTSFGRNVNPEWPESLLLASPVLRQAAVFGEALPGNVAVLVPTLGMPDSAVAQAIEAVNRELPRYARVHAWVAADAPFSADNGLATANGRVRRQAVEASYRERMQAALAATDKSSFQPRESTP